MNCGEMLKCLHKESGMTKAEVSKALNMDSGNYCRTLQQNDMLFSTFFRIADQMTTRDKICQMLIQR